MSTKDAFDTIKKAINDDPSYAWSWHCNIAMCYVDAGGEHKAANHAAANFMEICFDVDVTKSREWKGLMES